MIFILISMFKPGVISTLSFLLPLRIAQFNTPLSQNHCFYEAHTLSIIRLLVSQPLFRDQKLHLVFGQQYMQPMRAPQVFFIAHPS